MATQPKKAPAARVKLDDKAPQKTGGLYFGKPKEDVQFIPSGCKLFDLALGGGWARRRIANIVGDKSTGKTLLAIEAAANFNLIVPKGKIRYREAESAFDESYAAALGFPVNKVDFGEPIDTIEDLFEDLEKVIEGAKGDPELYIVDSLDALSDRAEMDRDIDEGSYGTGKAKMLSQLFRRQVRALAEKDITLIVISQVRDNIGVMVGKKTTRSGGRALDFYSSQTAWLQQIQRITKEVKGIKRVVGVEINAKLEKNKIALPFREAQFQIRFGYGIDDYKACTEFLKQLKIEHDKNIDLPELHRMIEEQWWDIENKFLPTESKYGS